MITEDFISFETAKLLKEKGFDELCFRLIRHDGEMVEAPSQAWNRMSKKQKAEFYLCPTLQIAMKWLREVHHIEISITFGFPFIDGKQQYKYFWSVVKVYNNHLEYPMDDPNNATYNEETVDSYEQAVEAGIKYCLKNLI